MTLVHGDALMSVGSAQALADFKAKLEQRFEIKTQVIGPTGVDPLASIRSAPSGFGVPIAQESRVLKRVVRWTEDGWEVEPDQRHVDILVPELALVDARLVSAPGETESKAQNEYNELLDEPDSSRNRAVATRAKFLAARDLMFAVRESCRSMSRPTAGALRKLNRVCRHLVGTVRLTTQYAGVVTGYSDSDWAGCRVTG